MSEAVQVLPAGASERRIRFVEEIAGEDVVLMRFHDPAPRYAILSGTASLEIGGGVRGDVLDVVLLPLDMQLGAEAGAADWLEKPGEADVQPPILVKYRGVELAWRPGRAVLQCDLGQAELLLAAVVEFTHYESELRRIEREIADAWGELEQDKGLAFEVKPADLKRSEAVGGRMNQALARRIRLARIEPHLYETPATLPAASRKLGEELREKARIEMRLEAVDGQLEVFEDVYEMSGQRMGEYRAAREEQVLEWVIILLLAAELVLMLVQAVGKFAG
ncbi:MAG: hypothetical protein ABSG84_17180 [Acidobacteriaceae bacterium]|jgi:hypothetical protein